MRSKYDVKAVFVFIIGSKKSSIYDLSSIIDVLYKDGEQCIGYMSTDSAVEGISVRVIVGI